MKTVNYEPKGFGDIFNTPLGQQIWDYLNTDDIWVRLELTTQLGHPAVEGIGDKLLEKFGAKVKEDRMKQAIGHMVRAIMESHDYDLDKKGIRCRKKTEVFVFAAKYKKRNHTGNNHK
jgi:hypothetical protein